MGLYQWGHLESWVEQGKPPQQSNILAPFEDVKEDDQRGREQVDEITDM